MTKKVDDTNKASRREGTEFRGLSAEASNELHAAMLSGLKMINEYFKNPQSSKKNLMVDMKIATTVLNTYSKLRQAESGEATMLLQMIKLSGMDAKELLKPYVIRALPHYVDAKT